jgi:serine/threonine protein kinase/tetratricopeptide (TPR) repeat protein
MAELPRVVHDVQSTSPVPPPPGQEDRRGGSDDRERAPDRPDLQRDICPPQPDPLFIGPYRILQRVGEGGMGIVYKCEQRDPVRRTVAIKVIKVGMDTREVVARFSLERQALSLLNHPNVAEAIDAGTTETGRPYFAMEYVAGVPLTQYCDENRLTTRERVELFIPVCHAVQHAHQKGIVHRDLKPTNILVTMHEGKPVPKVIDFGIAKATNYSISQQTLFTKVGAMIGTPEYMSPEQAGTSALDVDTRADVYSLGVVLYELLTGALPIDPKQFRAQSADAIARILRESEPKRPSTRLTVPKPAPADQVNGDAASPKPVAAPDPAARRRTDPRTLFRELRGDLDWIVMKCLERDRTRRYETANGLAMDLRRHLDHEPVSARPPTTVYRFTKMVRRHKAAVAAALAILLSLLLGIAATTLATIRARAERTKALAAERIAVDQKNQLADMLVTVQNAQAATQREADRAVTVSRFLQDVLAPPERDGDEQARDARVVDLLARAEKDVGERFKGQPDIELQTRYALFRTYSNLGLAGRAIGQLDRAWNLVRQTDSGRTQTGLRIAADHTYYFRGSSVEREKLARETARAAAEQLGDNHEATILANNVVAITLANRGEGAEADKIYRRLVDQLRSLGPGHIEDANAAAPFSSLGVRQRDQGKYAEAQDLFREGLTYANAARYNRFRMRWICSSRLAETLTLDDKLADAAALYRDIFTEVRQKLGADHPSVGPEVNAYVGALRRLEREQDALDVERKFVADLTTAAAAPDPPAPAVMPLSRRAYARVCVGRFEDAARDFDALIKADPGEHWHWYYQACVLSHLQDAPRFDQLRRDLLARFETYNDRFVCVRLAKAALLMPGDAQETRTAEEMTRRADDLDNDRWYRLARALADYRARKFDDTLYWCQAAEKDPYHNPAADASIQSLRALALQARGATAQARQALQRADEIVARDVPTIESGRIGGVGIENWLICQTLLREAHQALP